MQRLNRLDEYWDGFLFLAKRKRPDVNQGVG